MRFDFVAIPNSGEHRSGRLGGVFGYSNTLSSAQCQAEIKENTYAYNGPVNLEGQVLGRLGTKGDGQLYRSGPMHGVAVIDRLAHQRAKIRYV